ncbi:MAG: putative 2OG-Fe(II) oxygenase, partial [Pseudomonadota bacterium]
AELIRIKGTVLQFAGDAPAALATLLAAADRHPTAPLLLDLAGMRLREGNSAGTLALTRQVLAAVPGFKPALEIEAQAHLVGGDPREGARIAEALYAEDPESQYVLLILTTAWRMLGDPRGEALTDPARFVRTHRIPAPAGWPSREAFLDELSRVVRALHGLQAHPFQQSLRGGSQTQGLLISEEPVIKAFFHELDGLIANHIAWLGEGDDPVRARISGGFRIKAAWSVLLRSNGFHVNHFHPEGWLSSAFYIETPAGAVDAGDHQGWLKFGEPGIPTVPALKAQHHVRPEPGLLALFPSYVWHGTVPFDSPGETRMSIAFDVVPT